MKRWVWADLAEMGERDFVGSSNTRFFRPKCAKTRLQASIISKFVMGVTPSDPQQRERWEGKGEACELGKEKRETIDMGDEERSSDILMGGDLLHCFRGDRCPCLGLVIHAIIHEQSFCSLAAFWSCFQ
jgi:hypothetical protein